MPFPLLAHQAVVLPLKLRWPAAFSGTALCIGSLAPDLEYLLGDRGPGLGHTLGGQFAFCLPITVVATWGVSRLVVPAFASSGSTPSVSAGGVQQTSLAVVCYSALVGSASHGLLDGLTHRDGWGVRIFPHLADDGGVFASRARLLQYGISIALSVTAIVLLLLWRRTRHPRPTWRIPTAAWAGAFLGGMFGVRQAGDVIRAPILYFVDGTLHAWGYLLFSFVVFGFVGVCVAAGLSLWLGSRRTRA